MKHTSVVETYEGHMKHTSVVATHEGTNVVQTHETHERCRDI